MPQQDLLTPAGERAVTVPLGVFDAPGTLAWPEHPSGLVLVAQSQGAGPGALELTVARELRRAGLATLHLDLLPRRGPAQRPGVEPEILGARLLCATEWALDLPEVAGLATGYLGTGEAAAAGIRAAALASRRVHALVTLGGHPDRVGDAIGSVRVPTLLMAREDEAELEANRRAFRRLDCIKRLVVFGTADWAEEAGRRAAGWMVEHLAMAPRWRERRADLRCACGA